MRSFHRTVKSVIILFISISKLKGGDDCLQRKNVVETMKLQNQTKEEEMKIFYKSIVVIAMLLIALPLCTYAIQPDVPYFFSFLPRG